MKKTIAVILPAYNEELTIAKCIRDFNAQLPESIIVVVDNNSTDDTVKNAKSELAKLGDRGFLLREPRAGKGNAIRRAFSEIWADYYIICDSDDTYSVEGSHSLLEPLLAGEADLVVGNRHELKNYEKATNRVFHGTGNKLVNWLIYLLYKVKLNDVMSGYRGLTARFAKHFPIIYPGFEIETEMTLHALDKRFRVKEVAIEYKARPYGSFSKLRTFSDGFRVLSCIAHIFRYYKPLYFFLIISFLFAISGLVFGIPVIYEWIVYSYITRLPLAVFASSLELIAIFFFGIGIVLDSIAHHNKLNYELMLLKDK